MFQLARPILADTGRDRLAVLPEDERRPGDRPGARLEAELWAIEIKLTSEPSTGDMDRLRANAALITAHRSIPISLEREPAVSEEAISASLPWFLDFLASGSWR
jgi:hypothetical protein